MRASSLSLALLLIATPAMAATATMTGDPAAVVAAERAFAADGLAMVMLDVLAGFIVTIIAARRDTDFGVGGH